MFSRIISAPFVLAALVSLYLTWEVDQAYAVYIAPPVIMLALIYVLSPQIDWWWYQRRPPKLDPLVETLLNRYSKFYIGLTSEEKKRFRERVALYMISKNYMPQAMESVPMDVKGLIASSAVWITFGKDDYLLSDFEQIIVYPHPFPSPQYPEKFHASEIYKEDGVIMFSAEQFMLGFIQTEKYYHIGLHEYLKVFMECYPHHPYPKFDISFWERMPLISGLNRESLVRWLGIDDFTPTQVAMVHFFTHPARFKQQYPEAYQDLQIIFRLDPMT